MTLAVEPTVRRIDETSGERIRNFEFETTINADLELVRNRLYAGFNLLYEPEVTRTAMGETRTRSQIRRLGRAVASDRAQRRRRRRGLVSAALRRSESDAFTGDAVMLGPTLYIRFTPKMFMTAAWNAQVWGREIGNPVSLNLAEFQRHRARLNSPGNFKIAQPRKGRHMAVCIK